MPYITFCTDNDVVHFIEKFNYQAENCSKSDMVDRFEKKN